MITSPSQNDLATTFVYLHNAIVPVRVVEISAVSTAWTAQRMKDLQNTTFLAIARGRYFRERSITIH
jgi:hypothetical protein